MLVISAAAAAAGAQMIVSLRDIYVVGPLMALVLIPSASYLGCAIVSADWSVAARALRRLGVDAGFVVAASALVFWIKQRRVHKRRPLD
jgi:multisubunit Na+/H+ antiporter MnhE subunit